MVDTTTARLTRPSVLRVDGVGERQGQIYTLDQGGRPKREGFCGWTTGRVVVRVGLGLSSKRFESWSQGARLAHQCSGLMVEETVKARSTL